MLHGTNLRPIFVSVFHRILDFKAGLDFYLGPFFYARLASPLVFSRQSVVGHLILNRLQTPD